ncbi:hypothetical protein TWF506_009318 [Arthrobotrys conoides]|uniref:WSC domain-containing protein n=1 Tax=Arthrobotrys conoides TaxID=74498 RepID=A0AAN8NUZ0_9PEZI
MRLKGIFLVLAGLSACPGLNGQSVQCITVGDGCDSGGLHEDAVNNAINRFQNGLFYGGGSEPVVFSSALKSGGAALAMLSYTCNGGTPPPRLEGSAIRGNFRKILSCANRCGGVASSTNSNCGFGILISNRATSIDCFSKAIDQAPQGTTSTTTSRTTTTTTGVAIPTINAGTNGFTYYGCYSDDVNSRVLSNQYVDANGMTIAACMARAAGYNFAGVEYGQECWYGNVLSGSQSESSGCNMPCPGKSSELCGGGNRIQLYKNPSFQPPNTPNLGAWTSSGCYTDSVESRGLDHTSTDSAMTIQKCLQLASGFKYAAVQYHNECFWGNVLKSSSVPAASGDCNAACAGDSSQICGGGNRLSLYTNGDYQEPQVPEEPEEPSIHEGNEDWSLVGCRTDSASNRALENSKVDSAMTVEKCFELAFSYRYAAVQGGNTCYWGDELGSSSEDANINQCNTPCAGRSDQACGGSLKNALYSNTDFDDIDVPGMISLMEELYQGEKLIHGDLGEYENQRLQAEAESQQGGSKHKRFIPALWVARLAATWGRARLRTQRVLRTNIRFQARMQQAWRKIGPYLQRYLQNRPQAPQQFEMQALIPAQQQGALIARRGGQIMAIEAERAAQGVLVAVAIAADVADAAVQLYRVITWHQDIETYGGPGPVQPTDPPDDPDDPPDDPDDPQEPLKPCPCGLGGCINLGRKLARSEPMKPAPKRLEKRTSGSPYTLSLCPGLTYRTLDYPSSSELIALYTSAGVAQSIPYYDLFFWTPPGQTQCSWSMDVFSSAQPQTPGLPGLAEYQTEHPFENNLMKGFFDRMRQINCAPCAADPNGPGLSEMFFNTITAPANSRYENEEFARFMVSQMSWYSETFDQGFLQDFVLLEARANRAKYQILTGTTNPNQSARGLTIQRFIEKIARVQGVFQYLNDADVSAAWVRAFNRIEGEFAAFDGDVYGSLHPPRSTPGSACAADVTIPAGQLDSWAFRFHNHISAIMIDVETKMAQWAINTAFNMRVRRNELWPLATPNSPVPVPRAQVDAWLATQEAAGGLLHASAYRFDRVRYARFHLP